MADSGQDGVEKLHVPRQDGMRQDGFTLEVLRCQLPSPLRQHRTAVVVVVGVVACEISPVSTTTLPGKPYVARDLPPPAPLYLSLASSPLALLVLSFVI